MQLPRLLATGLMESAVSFRLFFYGGDSALLVLGRSVSVIEGTLGHELTSLINS